MRTINKALVQMKYSLTPAFIPISVNYHFTRKCNYSCGFCFHTAKTSTYLPIEKAKLGLKMLAESGMKKLNFAGGEPLLREYHKHVGELCKYAKQELHLESVSIISNGSQLNQLWFQKYGEFVDIMGFSCDSFDEDVNIKIGRGRGTHLSQLRKVRNWCETYNVKFKLNSVINKFNYKEDMVDAINALAPFRWKVFQVFLKYISKLFNYYLNSIIKHRCLNWRVKMLVKVPCATWTNS